MKTKALKNKLVLEEAKRRKIGEYDKNFHFIDTNGKYNYSDARRFRKVFLDEDLTELMDENWAEAGHLNHLMNFVDRDNMICYHDSHKNSSVPVADKTTLYKIAGYKDRKTGSKFVKKLFDKKVICTCTINGNKKCVRFFVNPVLTIRSAGISLELYKLFKEQIDEKFPMAKNDFEQLCYIEEHLSEVIDERNSNDELKDSEMDLFIESLKLSEEVASELAAEHKEIEESAEIENAIDKARQATFNPFLLPPKVVDQSEAVTIAYEYICDNEAPVLYKLGEKGMQQTEYSLETDMYFTPNLARPGLQSNPKNGDIIKYRSWFIDLDSGKDSNGHYFDMDEVEKRKAGMRRVIDALPISTYINETRNGFQIFFSCDNVKSEGEWRTVEDKLIDVVKITDKAVRNPSRLMRVPGSMWVKAGKSAASGCEKFQCKALAAHRKRYTADDLLKALDDCAENVSKLCDEYNKEFNIEEKVHTAAKVKVVTMDNVATNARIEDIKNLTLDTFDIATSATVVSDIKSYVKQQSLADFLAIDNPSSFRCIFHSDHHPSARIYCNAEDDRYVCASSNCTVSPQGYDIIDCVMRLSGCSYAVAINYLSRVYNVTAAAVA